MALVYDKALRSNPSSGPPSGKILNLLTSDVGIIDRCTQFLIGLIFYSVLTDFMIATQQVFSFIMTPLQLIGIMVLLWRQIGAYSLISLGILLLVLPLAGFAGKVM